ncbi:hypothetical protein AAK967_00005 [Atopobiaceae bacterium 24-176]
MGECVFVMGRTGSGKSYSLRNFEPGTVGVFSVGGKRMPFPDGPASVSLRRMDYAARYTYIEETLRANNLNAYVIDDSSFLQADENLERALEGGDQYRKFLEIGVHLASLVQAAADTDDDTIVYFLHHVDVDDIGRQKVRSIGKLVEEKYNPVERCNLVLTSVNRDGDYRFIAKNDGLNLSKCPPGMLPDEMGNDLAEVDRAARAFWHMAPPVKAAEKAAARAAEETGNDEQKEI